MISLEEQLVDIREDGHLLAQFQEKKLCIISGWDWKMRIMI